MSLDFNTLLVVNAVNLFLMSVTLVAIMGRQISTAAANARASLIVQAVGWLSFGVTGLLGAKWQSVFPASVVSAYQSLGLWLLPSFSVACTSASIWLMFRALQGWLGPRPGNGLMYAIAILGPVGYALSFDHYAVRVGWANGMLALQLLMLCLATLRPKLGAGGSWRWVIFACTLMMAGFTAARSILGAFYTASYPAFGTPHPINIWALVATNVSMVLMNLAVLVAWRQEAELQLRNQAFTDALTGLCNRHCWEQRAPVMLDQARRHGNPLALLMVDLDHFKHINDTLGHDAGDRVLRTLGAVLSTTCRSSDMAARVGGEEFVVLLPQTSEDAARLFEIRLRAALDLANQAQEETVVNFSSGLAMLQPGDRDVDALQARADKALYQAKANGRGRMCVAT
jgi:diguanylate cyclase (GGDEF)-like protein